MTKRAWILGVVAISAICSAGCSTLPRARAGTVEEVDALADVELTAEEVALVAGADSGQDQGPANQGPASQGPASQARHSAPPGVTEVSWSPSGKNIQLTKLPPVQPVTASMLALDKREQLLAKPEERSTAGAVPPRGLSK